MCRLRGPALVLLLGLLPPLAVACAARRRRRRVREPRAPGAASPVGLPDVVGQVLADLVELARVGARFVVRGHGRRRRAARWGEGGACAIRHHRKRIPVSRPRRVE